MSVYISSLLYLCASFVQLRYTQAKDAQTRERRACDQHRRELRVRRRRDVERLASAAPENDGGKAAAQDAQPSVGREDDEWSLSDGDIDEMRAGTWTRRSHGEPTPADEDFAAPPKVWLGRRGAVRARVGRTQVLVVFKQGILRTQRKRSKVQSELRKGPVVVRVLTEGSVGSAEVSYIDLGPVAIQGCWLLIALQKTLRSPLTTSLHHRRRRRHEDTSRPGSRTAIVGPTVASLPRALVRQQSGPTHILIAAGSETDAILLEGGRERRAQDRCDVLVSAALVERGVGETHDTPAFGPE